MSDYRELKDTVIRYAGQSAGGKFEQLINVTMNGVYRRLLDVGLVPHEHREFPLTTVSGVKQIGMPVYVRKVMNIEDGTNKKSIWYTTARSNDRTSPGSTESGDPRAAFSIGVRGVQVFPNSDGLLGLVSDETDDSGVNYKIRVTGFNTDGLLVTELVTMSGTTKVFTTNNYDSTLGVERITKAPATGFTFSGNITITDDDNNTISTIPVWWISVDYEWVQFRPIPSTAITYTVRAEMRKPPLVNDTDWPEIDQEYHDLLVWGTTKDILPTVGKSSTGDRHRVTFEDRLEEFVSGRDDSGNHIWIFANVQSSQRFSARAPRPLIQGVDLV